MSLRSSSANVKVTVGMCVKNSEKTVKEAIESVLNQDFPKELMEIIIVDGNSYDRTIEIIRGSLKMGMRVKIFYENEGLGRARQIVVDNAGGEYIVWVDGDMVLSEDFVRKQVEFMEHNLDVGIAKGKYGILKNVACKKLVAFLEDVEFMLSTQHVGETDTNVLATSGCIYRIKAIREAGGFDSFMKGVGEDMDAESRVRDAGWKLCITSAVFQEIRRQSWRALWDEYVWHGKGAGRLFRKNKYAINLYKMFPPITLATKLFQVSAAYRITHRKAVLLLPVHYIFKRVAWLFGFLKSFTSTLN
ncbi:MAG: glycosyltransferase [Candidatus Bathyarchaeia archaeon]